MNPLVDRYMHQVRYYLPAGVRDDVARELESLILDTLEDRARGAPVTDELVVQVLKEFGEPSLAASRYATSAQSLIPSQLLPCFFWNVRWLPVFLAGLFAPLFLLSSLGHAAGLGDLGAWLLSYAASLIANLGLLVVLFVVLGRLFKLDSPAADRFDPRKLPPLPAHEDPDWVSRGWTIAGTQLLVVILLVMNFFPQWFGLLSATWDGNGARFSVTRFSDMGFRVQDVAMLNVWLGSVVLLNLAIVVRGRWNRALRLCRIAEGLFGAGVLVWIMRGFDPRAAAPRSILGSMLNWGLAAYLLLLLWDCGYHAVKLLRPSSIALRSFMKKPVS